MNPGLFPTTSNVPYALPDCPICDQLSTGFCANAAQTGALPSIDNSGGAGDYTGGPPIWPFGSPIPVPACGSN